MPANPRPAEGDRSLHLLLPERRPATEHDAWNASGRKGARLAALLFRLVGDSSPFQLRVPASENTGDAIAGFVFGPISWLRA